MKSWMFGYSAAVLTMAAGLSFGIGDVKTGTICALAAAACGVWTVLEYKVAQLRRKQNRGR